MTLHTQELVTTFEEGYVHDVLQRLKEQLIDEHPDGLMPRDAHPKMHGLVQAEFTVHEHLPSHYCIGVFAKPTTYTAWVRFSNANGAAQPDAKRDIRGMAIKLEGVSGDKLSEEPDCAENQDFLLISTDVFLCNNVQTFDGMVGAIQGSLWDKLRFFACNLGVVWRLIGSFKVFANPLTIRYFSSTPYLLGEHPVKYCATPVAPLVQPVPAHPNDDFLREAMAAQLSQQPAEFVFGIQRQSNPERMPVEDASVRWDEAASPFEAVATLRILQQTFDTPERNRQGEDMRFSPWHCLAVHRPLGSLNRARRVVYHAISELRRRVNGVR
jgi:Catalase